MAVRHVIELRCSKQAQRYSHKNTQGESIPHRQPAQWVVLAEYRGKTESESHRFQFTANAFDSVSCDPVRARRRDFINRQPERGWF